MIRHGSTPGNELKRYIGRTDETLSEKGIREVLQLKEGLGEQLSGRVMIAASPMKRTMQTAQILFGDDVETVSDAADTAGRTIGTVPLTPLTGRIDAPGLLTDLQPLILVPDFRECDFGSFENKNYLELEGDPDYRRWIDSGGMLPFPGGESREGFQDRCCRAFLELYRKAAAAGTAETTLFTADPKKRVKRTVPVDSLVLVVHGGTIMSIAERFAADEAGRKPDYYAWHIGNAQALIFESEEIATEMAEDDHFLRRTGRIGLGEEAGAECE